MQNMEKYKAVFMKTFGVQESDLPELEYQGIEAWDSVGHMELIGEIEEVFGVLLEVDDMMDLHSFSEGIEILKKYDIEM